MILNEKKELISANDGNHNKQQEKNETNDLIRPLLTNWYISMQGHHSMQVFAMAMGDECGLLEQLLKA